MTLGTPTLAGAAVAVSYDTTYSTPAYVDSRIYDDGGTPDTSGSSVQTYSTSTDNPFYRSATGTVTDLDTASATATLNLGFSSSEIQFSTTASASMSEGFYGTAAGTENCILKITISDEPVQFKLQVDLSVPFGASNGNNCQEASFGGGSVIYEYSTLATTNLPQSGTVEGTLNPGTYELIQAATANGQPGAFMSNNGYVDLEFSEAPEPSTWALLSVGVGLLALAVRKRAFR